MQDPAECSNESENFASEKRERKNHVKQVGPLPPLHPPPPPPPPTKKRARCEARPQLSIGNHDCRK